MTTGPSAEIRWLKNPRAHQPAPRGIDTSSFSMAMAIGVRRFHQGIPGYSPTPLIRADRTAAALRLGRIDVKDESHRFGLNAFKILGASHAVCRAMAETAGISGRLPDFSEFSGQAVRKRLSEATCITATDGNHGRAVAWAARQIGCRCVVHMPAGSSPARLAAIRREGAQADTIDGNYDDAVALSAREASENHWHLVQDTAWEGYRTVPTWIMQGYLTLFDEAFEQLGGVLPTHVILQCGVGSFAAAGQAYLVERFGPDRPRVIVVEPNAADCFFRSMAAGDGRPHTVTGRMDTIMAGLACGTPSLLAWAILKEYADCFVACADTVTRRGMRLLAAEGVVSGESGAVGMGLLAAAGTGPQNAELAAALRLDAHSRVLLISTEGDTDPDHYREIVGEPADSIRRRRIDG